MLKEIFKYRGRRIRKFHLHFWLIHHFLLLFPFSVPLGFLGYYWIYPLVMKLTDLQQLILPAFVVFPWLILANLFVFMLMRMSQLKGGYFLSVRYYNAIADMLKLAGFTIKKEAKQAGKKPTEKFPKVYVKKKKHITQVTLPLDGGQHHDRFLQLGKKLEEMFMADLVSEERDFGFVTYGFMTDVIGKRIEIKDVIAKDGSIKLMEGVYWNYDSAPHMLVAGGTGGGKTYFLYSLIKAMLDVGTIDICDPKNADLADLSDLPVFKGHVHYGSGETMIRCLENGVKLMDKRFKYMKALPNYQSGKNYAYYDIPPHFIIFDEWKAFYTSLDYRVRDRVDVAVQQLVLKARQAGIFLVLATQRPDAADFPAGVRDNLMCKVTVGILAQVAYYMVYGDENKNKAFFNKKIKGRGYIDTGGGAKEEEGEGVVREFYTPFVPPTFNFLEYFKTYEKMIVFDFDIKK
ncbi:cell division protein FtsK [Enterococcus durans]|uniref:Cell division protein FtsK n=1 Tax=Enterococcus durans TaxID=53345 RepID=A0A5N0YU82_9ENTE|nr:FtsK/SpoIIIE domain-containing protein [Enterococcus durans]KAA9176444.1 cell division protein FtsK [Enterococcus durans]KAA9182320.1 cell division protein FtsK [Enterococcus durans]KAA9186667.1 cell division protein FtsK [Enterococcus durans]KAA9191472.1 cell division protein FtsK [Enterococcus durans]KAA9193541.1 cell division protein FtsK [Enterococcus durans]